MILTPRIHFKRVNNETIVFQFLFFAQGPNERPFAI